MRTVAVKLAYRLCFLWIWDQRKRRIFKRKLRTSIYFKPRQRWYTIPSHFGSRYINSQQLGNNLLLEELRKNKPCLITRFGTIEFKTVKYFYQNMHKPKVSFSIGYQDDIKYSAGFFSPSNELLTKYCCDVLQSIKNIDVFTPWGYTMSKKYSEQKILETYNKTAKLIDLDTLSYPFNFKQPWTQHLAGKKVLVCHPFEKTIQEQYKKRELLFRDPLVLPEFELKTLKIVQGLGDSQEILQYANWFDALESMYRQIDAADFDIALIAGGAFGMLLANYIKEKGKQAVLVAGALQLLFGIKGTRWAYLDTIMNEHWVYPSADELPKNLDNYLSIEGKLAYW